MSDNYPPREIMDDDATTRLRPPPPSALPGPLDLTATDGTGAGSTELLSIDDLMEPPASAEANRPVSPLPAAPVRPPVAGPIRTPAPAPAPKPVTQRSGVVTASPGPSRPGQAIPRRLRSDAAQLVDGARRGVGTWWSVADNRLILATVLALLLLVLVVSSV